MNKINLSEFYSVMIEKPLSDYDRKILNSLYLPIIGIKAMNIFYNFHDSVVNNEYESLVSKVEKTIRLLELSTDTFEACVNKLEAVGLVDTFYNDGMHVFYLKDIPTASHFFSDEVLYQLLIASITKEEADKLAIDMLVRRIDLTKFDKISKRFDEVFMIEEEINHIDVNPFIIDTNEGIIIRNDNFNYRHFVIFTSALGILNEEKLNKQDVVDFVNRYSFLYGLNEDEMKEAFACSLTSPNEVDFEIVLKNIKRIYNNKNKKTKIVVSKTENVDDERIVKLESLTPIDIVRHKYNESMVASEVATMDELLKTTGIGIGFLNTVLIYVLEERNGEIPTYNYFNKIIQTWKRAGVKTTADALAYLENLKNPVKKTYAKPKVKKTVPSWYNEYQEENKKDFEKTADIKEEKIEDLESFFNVKEN